MKYFALILVSLACGVAAFGQAAVESAILTGAGTGATTGAKGAGSAAAGVFGRLSEVVGKSGAASGNGAVLGKSATSTQPPASKASVTTAVPASKRFEPQPIDASLVTVGLSREDLIKCCGEPLTTTTEIRKSKFIETIWYTTTDKDEFKVQVEEGVVTRVAPSRITRANWHSR